MRLFAEVGVAPGFSRDESAHLLKRSTTLGILIFFADVALYGACVSGIAMAELWWVRLLCALAAGVMTALLFVVGHDACHQGLTKHRWLNGAIGRAAFLPALHPFSLWDLGHTRTHHRYTNQRGRDYVWEPLTPAEYHQLPRARRWAYRFFRTPAGHIWYYLCVIWWRKMFFPRPSEIGGYRLVYALDLILMVWAAVLPTAILMLRARCLSSWTGLTAAEWIEVLIFAIAVPFLVFNWIMSFVIFLHHTHPEVRWYRPGEFSDWEKSQVYATVHVIFPRPLNWVFHRIMEHTAHHLRPTMPMYRLLAAQELLESRSGGSIVVLRWSIKEHLRVLAICKCFDLDKGVWVGYDGEQAVPLAGGRP
jgi:omega-6 fatty acid desaturase (delta-12 desaturase)